MFEILKKETSEGTILTVFNKAINVQAAIFLDQGASLQELKLDNIKIIDDLHPLTYATTYASALLFPFVGRTAEGKYTFKGKSYQFDLNDGANALHGLLYNKTFEIINTHLSDDKAVIGLAYHETKKSKGFPFTYKVELTYTIAKNQLNVQFNVTNTDDEPFPYNIGWHPYFKSSDLPNSNLHFKSSKGIGMNAAILPQRIRDIEPIEVLPIKNQQFDDCFVLDKNRIIFETPEYKLYIDSSPSVKYLQIYTPPKANFIAIEPQTATANSFNNSWGLATLEAGSVATVEWQLALEKPA